MSHRDGLNGEATDPQKAEHFIRQQEASMDLAARSRMACIDLDTSILSPEEGAAPVLPALLRAKAMKGLSLAPELHGVLFEQLWETSRLWALPTPPTPTVVAELAWHLDLPVWSTVRGEPRFDLSPALELALRRPEADLVHHSERGCAWIPPRRPSFVLSHC